MKTRIHKLIIFSLLTLITFSCSNTEDDLFDETASLRLEKSREKYQKLLEEPNQNWLLQYFPHPDQELGGVNYYLTFNEGEVTAKMEGVADSKTSMYSVLNRGGNILSFYGYNELLHKYADPSVSKPKADQGDFEFLILGQKGDTINLKGVKTGNYMRLIKMSETPEEYEKKVLEMKRVFSNATLFGKAGQTVFDIDKTRSKITFAYGEKKEESIAYLYTNKGIYLYKPLKIDNEKFQEFIFNKENSDLVSVNGSMHIKLLYPPVNFIDTFWISNVTLEENASEKVREAWNQDAVVHKNRFPNKYGLYPFFSIGKGQFSIYIDLFGNAISIGYNLYFKASNKSPNNIIIEKNSPDRNWGILNLNSTLNLLIGEFKVEPDNKENPTKIRLTSVEDPEIWVNIELPTQD